MSKIRVGIVGYGNLGKGVQYAISQNPDMQTVAVFTRREPETVKTVIPVTVDKIENMKNYQDKIDVMILCGGSATDLPIQSVKTIKLFNTVDSFDTHAKVPEYYDALNKAGIQSKKLGAMSIGWDPGLFSLARILFSAVCPQGNTYTFWGKGVSQGHSDAIRRIKGVKDAKQYTVPVEDAIKSVRDCENPTFTTRQMHERVCYVVAEEGADLQRIEKEIKEMPNYFADYNTQVNFISQEELIKNHSGMPHGGFVLRSGESANDNDFLMELSLKLDSNPEFTSGVLVAYARAVYKMNKEGFIGAVTAYDIAPKYLSSLSFEEQRKKML